MRAGNFIRTSPQTDWSHNPTEADYLIRFLRGTNYTVQVSDSQFSTLLASNQAVAVNSGITGVPHYTGAYIAQIFLATNGLYPFIIDTNKLLGTNLLMTTEVLSKTAQLYIPDMTIAADVSRDSIIDFKNRTDRTATNNPFVFWINDDSDIGSDDTASDQQPTNSPSNLNCANNTIDGLRDLEDFTRLQFKIDDLPAQFLTNGNYQVEVYLTNLLGSPSIRLFHAVESNGGLGYLTNITTASAQTNAVTLGVLTNGTPLTLSSTNWLSAGSNAFFLPMIFEGISTGQCVINFGFSSNNAAPVALSRPFYLNLNEVTSLYEHWTVGDNNTEDWTQIPSIPSRTADSAVFGAPQKPEDNDYILLVHGWRMQPWERRAFASTAYKRLWQLGYKGRFGLYSWPTDWTALSLWDLTNPDTWENYDRSEQRAWSSGMGLYELMQNLNETQSPNRIRVIAHSMGNIVTSEALRLASVAGKQLPMVQSYIASQAASVAHAYDATNPAYILFSPLLRTPEIYAHFPRNNTNQPFFTGMRNAVGSGKIINFNNQFDYALNSTFAWPINQSTKPDFGWHSLLIGTNKSYTFSDGNTPLILSGNETYHDQVYDIYAHIAQAESKALGCAEDSTHHIQGEIGGAVNLNAAPFNYQNNSYEHSAEFNSINMNRRSYWWQVLSTLSLTNNLPQP